MRLIDADALQEQIQQDYNIFEGSTYLPDKARRDELSNVLARIINAPTIETESAWKPATIKPKTDGEYLVLWGLPGEHICGPYYKLLKYGTFEDDGDNDSAVKFGWYEWDNDFGAIVYTSGVRYWTELPDKPEVKE